MSPTSCQSAPPRARRNEDYSWPRKTVSTICDEMECRMIEFGAAVKPEFLLESGVAFLNHGSFGAAPRAVLEAAERWRQRMEANPDLFLRDIDRKSTRLNSSHVRSSYAVFCLKKNKKRASQRRAFQGLEPRGACVPSP